VGPGYDINFQPSRGGKESGQTTGSMETLAWMAHGAKSNLAEMANLKARENDEYWRNLQLGLPVPKPNENFAFDKMIKHLQQAGVNVEKNGDQLTLMPMTDEATEKISNGEVQDGGKMFIAKNLKEEKGGLFDEKIFGGTTGSKWGHMQLVEKIPNPVMEDAILKVTGLKKSDFENIISGKQKLHGQTGFKAIEGALEKIDVDSDIEKLKKELNSASQQKINPINKHIRYLEGLKKTGKRPTDYMISKIPIMPPKYRPIYPLPSGDLQVSPINKHYKDVSLINQGLKLEIENNLDDIDDKRLDLYNSVKALQGLADPISFTKEKYDGALKTLAGPSPKRGFIHNRLFSRKQDMTARSTVGLDPSLGLDEVGLPEDMLKKLYKPFVRRNLILGGLSAKDATKEIANWGPMADRALDKALNERPVFLNRAPSLHKHNVLAFKPKKIDGKLIKTNPMIHANFNLDHDGDCVSSLISITYDFENSTFWGSLISSKLNLDLDNFMSYIKV
jgi:DNA-directed RNA polymerase beta' subunit